MMIQSMHHSAYDDAQLDESENKVDGLGKDPLGWSIAKIHKLDINQMLKLIFSMKVDRWGQLRDWQVREWVLAMCYNASSILRSSTFEIVHLRSLTVL